MFCPSCGKENANAFGYCNFCGRALTPVPGGGPGPAIAPAPAPVVTQPMQPKRKASPILVGIAIFTIAFISVGIFLGSKVDRETPDQRIGRLVREAAGLQPVKNLFFSSDRQFDDAFREQYRNLLRINREYMEAVHQSDTSAVAHLFTAVSFAEPASAADGLKQLHAVYDLDMGQEQKVQEVIRGIRHIIETSSWSASNRQAFLDGFERGAAQVFNKRQGVVSAEQAWIAAVDDVYAYAGSNHSSFVLNGSQLIIPDNQVLHDFNAKIDNMNSRRQRFVEEKHKFDQWQADLFKDMGVNASDIGLPKQ